MLFHTIQEIPINLDTQLVIKRLRIITEKSNPVFKLWVSVGTYKQKFTGQIKGDSFEISRILGYKNSFNPLINGKIVTNENEKKLILEFTLRPIDKALLIVFGIIVSIIFFIFLVFITQFSMTNLTIILIMLGFPFGYLILLGVGLLLFNSLSKESIKILRSLCNKR